MTWNEYQEAIAQFFRQLGYQAVTNQRVKGVRATHDIDVLVTLNSSAVESLWVVECKLWNRAITKQCVLTLQQIVADVGADRGFLLSESGFQAGAVDATLSSNITLTTLAGITASVESFWFSRPRPSDIGLYQAWYRDDEDSGMGAETYLFLQRRDKAALSLPISCAISTPDGIVARRDVLETDLSPDRCKVTLIFPNQFDVPLSYEGFRFRVVWHTIEGPVCTEAYLDNCK
jgi:hypothetical protein